MSEQTEKPVYVTTSEVCARYRRNKRTIDRWIEDKDKNFPPPMVRGRGAENLWLESQLDQWDAMQAVAQAWSPSPSKQGAA